MKFCAPRKSPSRIAFVTLLAVSPGLSGCVLLAAGGVVAGVSAVRQERTIGNAVDDTRIKSTLDTRLAQANFGTSLAISTTVIEGRVLMAGHVDSPDKRLDATRVAWSVEGVRKVDNAVEVTEGFGWLDRPSDLITRTRLAAILLGDKEIKDVNYTTDVVHGVIYLMGVAQSQAEIDRVVAHAQGLGAVRVENYVVLKDDPIRYGFGTQISQ
ncbi:MAG: BON domain-containing protein [Alphaproteobacteria bacterium]|nr:BON domain-containing protein [Alphaproteobacteria bacterium]